MRRMAPCFEKTDSIPKRPDDSAAAPAPAAKNDRENRQANALRQNLMRRKASGAAAKNRQ